MIKMCGWWAKAGRYRALLGCDIKNGDVAYKSYNEATYANQVAILEAVTAMDGYYMVSSSGKLFYAAFWAGEETSTTGGQGSGKATQYGSNYLATELGYTWQEILHYYYDNSAYNNPNVGIVSIGYAD